MELYFGLTSRAFHDRWMEHKQDMKNIDCAGMAFSKKVRELRNAGKSFDMETKLIKGAHTYKTGDSNCDLYLTEKTCIALNHAQGTTFPAEGMWPTQRSH